MERIKRAIEASKLEAAKRAKKKTEPDNNTPEYISSHNVLNHDVLNQTVENKGKIKQSSLTNPDDVNIEYEQTRVVSLNQEQLAKNRIVAFNKNNHLSLGFDILRTQVINKMLENGWRTLAITSPIPECGKTTVSINLAMSIAHHTNRTAMLVDFDLRRPTVSKTLGLPTDSSLNEVLSGKASIADALINPGLEGLVILPTAIPVKHSSEVLSSRKVENLVTELRERYAERIVIFDLPPLLGTDDTMIMLSQVDCVLVVVGNGMVSKTDLTECMRYVDPDKLLGTVLNKSKSEQSDRGYYYS